MKGRRMFDTHAHLDFDAYDADRETVSMGHRLHPRLLVFPDSDFTEVSTVLSHLENCAKDRGNAPYQEKAFCNS